MNPSQAVLSCQLLVPLPSWVAEHARRAHYRHAALVWATLLSGVRQQHLRLLHQAMPIRLCISYRTMRQRSGLSNNALTRTLGWLRRLGLLRHRRRTLRVGGRFFRCQSVYQLCLPRQLPAALPEAASRWHRCHTRTERVAELRVMGRSARQIARETKLSVRHVRRLIAQIQHTAKLYRLPSRTGGSFSIQQSTNAQQRSGS